MNRPVYCVDDCVIKNKENCGRSYRYCRRFRGLKEAPAMSEYKGWLRCQGCGLGYNPESDVLKIPENKKHACPQCGSTKLLPLEKAIK